MKFIRRTLYTSIITAVVIAAPTLNAFPVYANETGVALIADTTVLEHFQQGDSNQPTRAWLAFQELLKAGASARPQIDLLLKSKASASRLYGAILLGQIDKVRASKTLEGWQNDKSKVIFSQGCTKEETTLGELAKRLLKGDQLVMLKNPN